MRCSYCQNAEIANGTIGKEVDISRLVDIFLEQQRRGALNINLVTPTHFAPTIALAVHRARERGLQLPIVYNTSGYESVEALDLIDGIVDIYLTDFKYSDVSLAAKLSAAPDYPEIASLALDKMYEQVGPYTTGNDPRPDVYVTKRETDVLHRGIVVRHLVLPGHIDNSLGVIDLLAGKPYAADIALSLMSQYTPMEGVFESDDPLASTVAQSDYLDVVDYALDCGFDNSFMQEGSAASESFIPEFDYSGI